MMKMTEMNGNQENICQATVDKRKTIICIETVIWTERGNGE